jgi:hypothetical protein
MRAHPYAHAAAPAADLSGLRFRPFDTLWHQSASCAYLYIHITGGSSNYQRRMRAPDSSPGHMKKCLALLPSHPPARALLCVPPLVHTRARDMCTYQLQLQFQHELQQRQQQLLEAYAGAGFEPVSLKEAFATLWPSALFFGSPLFLATATAAAAIVGLPLLPFVADLVGTVSVLVEVL